MNKILKTLLLLASSTFITDCEELVHPNFISPIEYLPIQVECDGCSEDMAYNDNRSHIDWTAWQQYNALNTGAVEIVVHGTHETAFVCTFSKQYNTVFYGCDEIY